MKINIAFLSIISLYHSNEYFLEVCTLDGADLAKFETKSPLVVEFGITAHLQARFETFEPIMDYFSYKHLSRAVGRTKIMIHNHIY